MALDQNNDTSLEDFVRARFKKTKYVMSVCSGAVTLAKAGVLKGKRATTTESLWWWVTPFGKGVKVCISSFLDPVCGPRFQRAGSVFGENADASVEVGSNCAMGGGWKDLDKFRCDFR